MQSKRMAAWLASRSNFINKKEARMKPLFLRMLK
jgi:hypothetical protein